MDPLRPAGTLEIEESERSVILEGGATVSPGRGESGVGAGGERLPPELTAQHPACAPSIEEARTQEDTAPHEPPADSKGVPHTL